MPEYRPDGAVLEAFLQSTALVRGIRGPYGSGKSTAACCDLLDRGMEQAPGPDGVRRTRFAAVRNTYGELKTTTLKDFEAWAPGVGSATSINRSARPIEARIRCRLEDRTIVDSEWYFIALDREEDIRKLLSLQLTGAWLNEARELERGVVVAVKDRVGRFPRVVDGGPTWHGIVMDTNPSDTEHWWYEMAESKTPQGWEFFAQPPGDSEGAENLRWLLPDYYEQLKSGATEDEIRVKVLGQYGWLQEGQRVYPDYQDWLHCGDKEIAPNKELPLRVGLDFGWSAAAEIFQVDRMRRYDAIDELYSEEMTTAQFAGELAHKLKSDYRGFAIAGIHGDPSGVARSPLVSEDQPNTHIQICAAAGVPVAPAPTNDFRLRRDAVARALRTLIGGRPQLMVSRKAVMLRKGFNGRYRFPKRTTAGDDVLGASPVKNAWSHPHDAAQYVFVSSGEAEEVLRVERPRMPVIPRGKGYGAWLKR